MARAGLSPERTCDALIHLRPYAEPSAVIWIPIANLPQQESGLEARCSLSSSRLGPHFSELWRGR